MTMIRDLPATARRGIGPRIAHDPGDPLITSHCPFCGSGQVVGRSDGTISCDFCGQNYIVRVQPAFPGMPQMPSGPGAPSDVGPDGGLVDPGIIGPDGMPQDGGMPPEGDEGDEGPPFGDDDEAGPADGGGSDGTPPPADGNSDSNKNSSGKAPPPGGKGRKKSSRRVASRPYLGLQGQRLTEDQLVRHLAVALSGRDPAVLATLRREASARLAHYGSHVPLGTADEVRAHLAQDHHVGVIPGDYATLVKLHDHDHATRELGWEQSPDASRSPGFIARRAAG